MHLFLEEDSNTSLFIPEERARRLIDLTARVCILHLCVDKESRPQVLCHPVAFSMEGGGGCTRFVHGRSRTTVDPRIPTIPGRSTSGFHHRGSMEGWGGGWTRRLALVHLSCTPV